VWRTRDAGGSCRCGEKGHRASSEFPRDPEFGFPRDVGLLTELRDFQKSSAQCLDRTGSNEPRCLRGTSGFARMPAAPTEGDIGNGQLTSLLDMSGTGTEGQWVNLWALARLLKNCAPVGLFRVAKMTELHRRRRRRRTISISNHLWYKNCSAVVRVRKLALEALQS
jgi:hypothetical protein